MIGLGIAVIIAGYILCNLNSPGKVLFAQFYFILFSQALITMLGAPSYIMYLGDVCNLIILLHMIKGNRTWRIKKSMGLIDLCILAFFIIGIGTSILNGVEVRLVIWSLRNYGRFIVFVIGIVRYWQEDSTNKLFKSLFPILLINMAVSIVQYSTHAYSPDWIGGILGNYYGVNSYSMMLFMFAGAYYIDSFINQKEKTYKILLALISIMVCVVVADLKVFYFLFVIEAIVIMLQNKIGIRTIILFAIGSVLAVAIYFVCLSIYNSQNIFDINYIMYYLTESSYSYSTTSINRTDGIAIINRVFNFTNEQKLFGLGLGAGEYNSFFSGDIYNKYGNMHYIWFLYAWIYLENGIVGLVLFLFLLVLLLIFISKHKRDKEDPISRIACAMLVVAFILVFYNPSLRNDSGYLFYTIIGIAIKKCLETENEYEVVRY